MKNVKSVLHDEFTNVDEHKFSHNEAFVIDCGYFTHAVMQNKNNHKTFHDICMQCVNYLNKMPAKTHVTVVFDTFEHSECPNKYTQLRSYRHITLPIQILTSTTVYGTFGNAQNMK